MAPYEVNIGGFTWPYLDITFVMEHVEREARATVASLGCGGSSGKRGRRRVRFHRR
jgi:hypothetical protein